MIGLQRSNAQPTTTELPVMNLSYQAEHWHPIKGFDGLYAVSSFGQVKSLSRVVAYKGHPSIKAKTFPERILAKTLNRPSGGSHARHLVKLCKNNKQYTCNVARLVADAFIPNPFNYECVLHLDDDATNNYVVNLQWGSRDENYRQAVERNRLRSGDLHHASRLTDKQRKQAWDMLRNGLKVNQVARLFDVQHQVISDLKNGKIKGYASCLPLTHA